MTISLYARTRDISSDDKPPWRQADQCFDLEDLCPLGSPTLSKAIVENEAPTAK